MVIQSTRRGRARYRDGQGETRHPCGGSGGICWIRRMGLRLPRQDYEAGHVGGTQLHGRRVQTERR